MTARVGIIAAGLCGAAFAVAGCGHKQGSPIPASQAATIVARLNEAMRRSDARACHDLRVDTIPALQQDVSSLPPSVDSNIRATLSDGVNHLSDLVQQQCSSQTTTTPTTTIPTQTTPTQTTPTQTIPTQTTPTQTTPTHTNTTPTRTTPTNTTTTTSPGGGTPAPGAGGVGPGGTGAPGQKKKAGGGGD
jgi:hypothetical protein